MNLDLDKNLSLEQKLLTERRACPQCNFVIENPFVELCPRCNTTLPRFNVDCQGCVHQFLCPTEKNRKLTRQ